MKNIETILKELGIELTDEQKEKLKKEHNENYKTINEYEKQAEKIETLEKSVKDTEETLKSTQEKLKEFEGVDTKALNDEIEKLKKTITDNESSYKAKIEERDFNDLIEKAIAGKKGINAKAIMALLDIDALKASKNQAQDIETQLDALAKAENSKMLFGEPEPKHVGTGSSAGEVRKGGQGEEESLHDAIESYYNN